MQYRPGAAERTSRWRNRIAIGIICALALAIAEIWLLVVIGGHIGAAPVVLLVIAGAAVGSWLIRRRWRSVWQTLADAGDGRIDLSRPGESVAQIVDTGLVVAGGVALIFPGLITDVVGLICLIPVTRRLPGAILGRAIERRIPGLGDLAGPAGSARGRSNSGRNQSRNQSHNGGYGEVIEGEVVEDPASGHPGHPDAPGRGSRSLNHPE